MDNQCSGFSSCEPWQSLLRIFVVALLEHAVASCGRNRFFYYLDYPFLLFPNNLLSTKNLVWVNLTRAGLETLTSNWSNTICVIDMIWNTIHVMIVLWLEHWSTKSCLYKTFIYIDFPNPTIPQIINPFSQKLNGLSLLKSCYS